MPPYRKSQHGWLTGDSLAPETGRVLIIPGDLAFVMAVNGALLELTLDHNWQQDGTVTPEQAADAMRIMYFDWIASMNIFAPQAANNFFAGPGSGAAAPPTFRTILTADITAALTTPPPIGATTPAAGTFSPLTVIAPAAASIAAIIKGFVAQTADLLQIQNSAGGVLNAFKPDGRVDFGNVNGGGLAMNVYRASVANGSVAVFQGAGITNGGGIVVLHSGAVTGTIYALLANANSSGDGVFEMRQAGAGNSIFSHFVIGAGDAKSLYQKSGGATWALGMDQSDGSKFKLSLHSNLGTNDRLIFDQTGLVQHIAAVSATNAVSEGMTLEAQSTGTPAAGFGNALVMALESSTTNSRKASIIKTLWNVATDAGAIPDLVASAYYNPSGVPVEREGLRIRGGATGTLMSVFGAAPVAQQVMGAAAAGAAYTAAEQTMLQAVYNAVRNFGIGT